MSPETNLTVLIVEDNPDGAESLAVLLDMYGYTVRVAYDGELGLKAARIYHPDVVILDIGLPRMNGFDLSRELRASLNLETLLIAISGYTHKQAECRAAGIDHYFVKPVDPATIAVLLRDHAEAMKLSTT